MSFNYIDIHAHLNFEDYENDREEVINRALENRVTFINIGTNRKTSEESIKLAEKYDSVYATIGLHPIYTNFLKENGREVEAEEFDYDFYLNLARHPKVVGIGECGLDYFHLQGDKENAQKKQKEVFEQHLNLALVADKPLMIHCRDAYKEILEILEKFQKETNFQLRGNFHFFVGDEKIAQKILNLGFDLSFTGVITFASQYHNLVKNVPLERVSVETDSPYAAPIPYRGQRNEPVYVQEIAQKIAEIKGLKIDAVTEQLLKNASNLFKIKF